MGYNPKYKWIKPTYPTYSWGFDLYLNTSHQLGWSRKTPGSLQEIQQLTLRLNSLELRVAGSDGSNQAGAELRWENVKKTSDISD